MLVLTDVSVYAALHTWSLGDSLTARGPCPWHIRDEHGVTGATTEGTRSAYIDCPETAAPGQARPGGGPGRRWADLRLHRRRGPDQPVRAGARPQRVEHLGHPGAVRHRPDHRPVVGGWLRRPHHLLPDRHEPGHVRGDRHLAGLHGRAVEHRL